MNRDSNNRCRNPKRRGCKSCTSRFEQELCIEFEITFDVDIENVNVTDVTFGGRR